jgi:hypothetical protein
LFQDGVLRKDDSESEVSSTELCQNTAANRGSRDAKGSRR